MLEIIGDPEAGLRITKKFKAKLEQRLKSFQKEFCTKRYIHAVKRGFTIKVEVILSIMKCRKKGLEGQY